MSSSSVETPIESALANETSVFSGNSPRPPRWASISSEMVFTLRSLAGFSALVAPAQDSTMSMRMVKPRTMIRTMSPRSERGLAEQLLLRRGLRAPVLRRRRHLGAERGSGVPAPARIVKHAAGERDHVGLAGRDDVLGLSGLGDQADRHGGDTGRRLDRFRERHLIARRQRDLLQRRDAGRRHVDPVDAALFQFF